MTVLHSWGTWVGMDWPCIIRVLNPATTPDHSPVRWADLAPGTDLARASWESVSGRPWQQDFSGSPWPWEPAEGADSSHSRVPLMQILLEQATGTVWVGQWDGYAHRPRPEGSRHMTFNDGHRGYFVVEVTPELRRALEDPADPPVLPNRMWDDGGTFTLDADTDLPSIVIGCTKDIAEAIEADERLESVRVDPHDPIRV
ncbi:hypothetical protein [Arachnia propionica]|uniref:Uncharacterized protein n=1 Tax=Arachnia propionica TaxID=1750 RepID=A0A3P1WW46_9ACTN|nr:hypothetical protein [Arachnia propionica]RRD49977.1 hypothetical protein EII35_06325 [Arachnia propionica]